MGRLVELSDVLYADYGCLLVIPKSHICKVHLNHSELISTLIFFFFNSRDGAQPQAQEQKNEGRIGTWQQRKRVRSGIL